MNRADLRLATKQLAEKARHAITQRTKKAKGDPRKPSPRDKAKAHELFELRKEFLSDQLGSNIQLKYREKEPDWNTWEAIADFFERYHAALAEIDNKSARPLAEGRLRGI